MLSFDVLGLTITVSFSLEGETLAFSLTVAPTESEQPAPEPPSPPDTPEVTPGLATARDRLVQGLLDPSVYPDPHEAITAVVERDGKQVEVADGYGISTTLVNHLEAMIGAYWVAPAPAIANEINELADSLLKYHDTAEDGSMYWAWRRRGYEDSVHYGERSSLQDCQIGGLIATLAWHFVKTGDMQRGERWSDVAEAFMQWWQTLPDKAELPDMTKPAQDFTHTVAQLVLWDHGLWRVTGKAQYKQWRDELYAILIDHLSGSDLSRPPAWDQRLALPGHTGDPVGVQDSGHASNMFAALVVLALDGYGEGFMPVLADTAAIIAEPMPRHMAGYVDGSGEMAVTKWPLMSYPAMARWAENGDPIINATKSQLDPKYAAMLAWAVIGASQ